MSKKEFICISCPVGCMLTVSQQGEDITVSGNACARGLTYGKQEYLDPRRIVTSLIPVVGGIRPLAPVKTAQPVPKASIPDVLKHIQKTTVNAPIEIGQVLIEDVGGTGVSIVATRDA